MAFTREEAKSAIKTALDAQSDNSEVNPAEARDAQAEAIVNAFFDAMIGRAVTVQGTTSNGGTFSVTGIIIE